MKKEVIGRVVEVEKERIQTLMNLKNALGELVELTKNGYLSEEEKSKLETLVIPNYENTTRKFNQWWSNIQKKYKWNIDSNQRLHIDFITNEIYIIQKVNPNFSDNSINLVNENGGNV